ncbi:hypothetical protein AHAS_Ahas13G0304700 [Arachis hypogaea]
MDTVKWNPSRPDWWAGSAPSDLFIYTPFNKGDPINVKKQELIWVVGEPIQVMVELANPCGFDLRVDIPICSFRKLRCFSMSHLSKEVDNLLLGATQGLVLSNPFRSGGSPKLKNVTVPNISVVPPLPLLISRVVGGDGAIIL